MDDMDCKSVYYKQSCHEFHHRQDKFKAVYLVQCVIIVY